MKSKQLKNKDKGITLISLIVTIIILLILATVTINLILGENGIIERGKEAKFKNNIASVEEKVELYKLDKQMEKIYKGTVSQELPITNGNVEISNTLREQIIERTGENDIGTINLAYIDKELLNINLKHNYILDTDRDQVYDYEGEVYYKVKHHYADTNIGTNAGSENDEEDDSDLEQLRNANITINVSYSATSYPSATITSDTAGYQLQYQIIGANETISANGWIDYGSTITTRTVNGTDRYLTYGDEIYARLINKTTGKTSQASSVRIVDTQAPMISGYNVVGSIYSDYDSEENEYKFYIDSSFEFAMTISEADNNFNYSSSKVLITSENIQNTYTNEELKNYIELNGDNLSSLLSNYNFYKGSNAGRNFGQFTVYNTNTNYLLEKLESLNYSEFYINTLIYDNAENYNCDSYYISTIPEGGEPHISGYYVPDYNQPENTVTLNDISIAELSCNSNSEGFVHIQLEDDTNSGYYSGIDISRCKVLAISEFDAQNLDYNNTKYNIETYGSYITNCSYSQITAEDSNRRYSFTLRFDDIAPTYTSEKQYLYFLIYDKIGNWQTVCLCSVETANSNVEADIIVNPSPMGDGGLSIEVTADENDLMNLTGYVVDDNEYIQNLVQTPDFDINDVSSAPINYEVCNAISISSWNMTPDEMDPNRYHYELDGADAYNYFSLSPGTYYFLVGIVNMDGTKCSRYLVMYVTSEGEITYTY